MVETPLFYGFQKLIVVLWILRTYLLKFLKLRMTYTRFVQTMHGILKNWFTRNDVYYFWLKVYRRYTRKIHVSMLGNGNGVKIWEQGCSSYNCGTFQKQCRTKRYIPALTLEHYAILGVIKAVLALTNNLIICFSPVFYIIILYFLLWCISLIFLN